jgi:CubicO group peptidase (beta-lactamase class C family)
MKKITYILLFTSLYIGCSKTDTPVPTPTPNPTPTTLYFPPLSGSTWETESIANLGWKQTAVQPLLDFLQLKNTKGFIILVNGKIVMENYFNTHDATTNWYWASAGKTLTSTMTGIAQQENLININNKVSQYIGTGWTSETLAQENLITCKNLLTMTSGIEDLVNGDAVDPASLTYKADASTRWAYHNVYVKLQDVIAQASGQTFENYFNTKLKSKIGMDGAWITSGNNQIYWSTTRSMARFGLLMYNKGKWENNQILNETYFNQATTTSQNINLAYGYLWWLNGKTSYHLPQTQVEIPGSLITSAPNDMFMALGKNDQKIYIVPSKKMVVIRMGDVADSTKPNFALSGFDTELWTKISALF